MAITDSAKALINTNIRTNGQGDITAPVMNDVLQAILSATDTLDTREQRNARTTNYGSRVALGYLWNADGANSKITANSSWDCAYVAIQDNIASLEVIGATPSRFAFFTTSEIVYANSLGTNLTGKVPSSAKFCVINFRKSDNPGGYDIMSVRQIVKKDSGQKLRLLSIGNSYSQDALAYLPYIMQSLAPDVDVEVGVLYMSGATISNHVSNWTQNAAAYTLYRYVDGAWTSTASRTIRQALDLHAWDIIMMQQGSTSSWTWSNFSGLGTLINNVTSYIGYPVKLAWMTTMNRPKVNDTVYTAEQFAQHFQGICDCAQRVMSEYPFELCFPVGAAVENARGTSLNSLGDYGQLTYEGAHLQEGLPCQLAAYTVAIPLLESLGYGNRGILGEQTLATASWLSDKAIPGPNGTSVGATAANRLIAQKCAVMANKNKFSKSAIV